MECAYDNLFTDKTLAAEYDALQAAKRKQAREYAFEGHVIRLTRKHYEQWFSQVSDRISEAGFLRELSAIDDWMHNTPGADADWFFKVMRMVEKKLQPGQFLS